MPNILTTVEKEDERVPDPGELRVSSKTPVKKLAGAIFSKHKECGYAKLRAIGDGAIGCAFRAATIACGYLNQVDVDACMTGAFFVVELKNGEERNGSIINIEPR